MQSQQARKRGQTASNDTPAAGAGRVPEGHLGTVVAPRAKRRKKFRPLAPVTTKPPPPPRPLATFNGQDVEQGRANGLRGELGSSRKGEGGLPQDRDLHLAGRTGHGLARDLGSSWEGGGGLPHDRDLAGRMDGLPRDLGTSWEGGDGLPHDRDLAGRMDGLPRDLGSSWEGGGGLPR